jgi:hypothetical protein
MICACRAKLKHTGPSLYRQEFREAGVFGRNNRVLLATLRGLK